MQLPSPFSFLRKCFSAPWILTLIFLYPPTPSLPPPQVCAWISLFLREARAKDCTALGLVLPEVTQGLGRACDFSDYLMDQVRTGGGTLLLARARATARA